VSCRIVVALALLTSLARSAGAEESPTRIRVSYQAPPECPAQSAFTSQLVARTNRVRPDEAAGRQASVTIARAEAGFAGRLELSDDEGRSSTRDVAGDTCEEVVAALALVTALALDPEASTAPLPSTGVMPATEPETAPPAPAPASPSPAPAPAVLPLLPPSAPSPSPPTWHFAFGGDAAVRTGVTPHDVLTLAAFVELELAGSAFRASFERSERDTLDVDAATAAFRWTGGAIEACELQLSGSGFSASPCLRAEAGVLVGQGEGIVPAREERRAWVAVGATVRAEWLFLDPAFLDLGLGVTFPLIRDRFFFQPDTTVYRPPAAGLVARAGLGVRFP
jgi:hypothetical protein